jgi:hypothetical protein
MAGIAHAAQGDTDLHGDTDAQHWAERFAAKFHVYCFGDEGVEPMETEALMLTWFAGAIETGRMEGPS